MRTVVAKYFSFNFFLLLQIRVGSRILYRPISASVFSRPEARTGEVPYKQNSVSS